MILAIWMIAVCEAANTITLLSRDRVRRQLENNLEVVHSNNIILSNSISEYQKSEGRLINLVNQLRLDLNKAQEGEKK